MNAVHRFFEITKEEGIGSALQSTKFHIKYNILGIKERETSYKSFSYRAAQEYIQKESPVIVVGGAATGGGIKKFLDRFESPTIHAIEPHPESVEVLEKKFGDNEDILIHDVALGPDHGTVEFNIHPHENSSSVLDMSDVFLKTQGSDQQQEFTPESTIKVDQVPLDSITTKPDIIRYDLQGYELPALKGSQKASDSCLMIITEVSFVHHYAGQSLFNEVHQYLNEGGFQLYNMESIPWFKEQMSHGFAVYFSEEVYEDNEDLPVNPFEYRS